MRRRAATRALSTTMYKPELVVDVPRLRLQTPLVALEAVLAQRPDETLAALSARADAAKEEADTARARLASAW